MYHPYPDKKRQHRSGSIAITKPQRRGEDGHTGKIHEDEKVIDGAHAAPPFRQVESKARSVKTPEAAAPGHEG